MLQICFMEKRGRKVTTKVRKIANVVCFHSEKQNFSFIQVFVLILGAELP